MNRERGVEIAKQDGTLEQFSDAKLRNCLASVLTAVRQDVKLANPLARAVAMHIEGWTDRTPPTAEYVYRCVQAVLEQTGLPEAARCMAGHRRRRRARRKQIRVVYHDAGGAVHALWSKARVAAALRESCGLSGPVARILAREVEASVFALGFRFVQSTLVAALIQNELLAWGLSAGEFGLDVGAAAPVTAPPATELPAEGPTKQE